ncbi:hypothetical protein DOY81_000606 [Sarcophaga bullata]|nr:hypothetical protein DOY81_000606 [Sarcophaga bullata]
MSSSGETLCGAISPTTSVASAVLPGCSNTANYLRSLANDENTCNTLPHVTSTASSPYANATSTGTSITNNLQLNRNLVMLRNHLRKNTNNATTTTTMLTAATAGSIGSSSGSTAISNNSNNTSSNNTNSTTTTGSSRETTKEQ